MPRTKAGPDATLPDSTPGAAGDCGTPGTALGLSGAGSGVVPQANNIAVSRAASVR
jgi:hypothetical protein